MFNAYMTGQALAPVVRDAYGEGLQFYQLYADYSWGQTQQASMEQFMTDVPAGSRWTRRDPARHLRLLDVPLGGRRLRRGRARLEPLRARRRELRVAGRRRRHRRGHGTRRPAVQPPDGGGGRRRDRGHLRHVAWDSQIDNEASNAFTQAFRTSTTASRPGRPSSPTRRRSSTRPPPSGQARSTRRRSSGSWRTTSTATSAWAGDDARLRPPGTARRAGRPGASRAEQTTGTSSHRRDHVPRRCRIRVRVRAGRGVRTRRVRRRMVILRTGDRSPQDL